MIAGLNRQLAGWAALYKFTAFTAHMFRRIDIVFWKMAHWLGHKYRSRIKPLMRKWYRPPEPGKAKTWLVFRAVPRRDLPRHLRRRRHLDRNGAAL
ncbi:group II intron maturase-specific domain-containing protein [Bradyrhizobium sp. CB82]|nr:group II intron maturase-specific domain-containing protein [Bradyrhizobium sp. CB82]WFU39922.1 group II intron maturase-specific domain-containing protein [Bradyrhizobium sp. CB82]